jgi:thiamine biosynthesis lipoprotein
MWSVTWKFWQVVLLVALNLSSSALPAQGATAEFREVHLGMEVRIVLAAAEGAPFAANTAIGERSARLAFDRIAELDGMLSDWRATSELRRLETATRDQWVDVSRELATVLALALEVARATDGQFDPTVGPLTRLWREAARTGVPIAVSAREAARRRVDYQRVDVDLVRQRVRLRRDSMALDLGAIAKGFIIDEALATLQRAGVPAALVEAGGDMAVFGAPVGTVGWRVAVPRRVGDTVVVLRSGAISTSGDAAQRVVGADGTTESHVFAPRSGRGLSAGNTITVMGSRAAVTDALATAMSLVSPLVRRDLMTRFGVQLVADGDAEHRQ